MIGTLLGNFADARPFFTGHFSGPGTAEKSVSTDLGDRSRVYNVSQCNQPFRPTRFPISTGLEMST